MAGRSGGGGHWLGLGGRAGVVDSNLWDPLLWEGSHGVGGRAPHGGRWGFAGLVCTAPRLRFGPLCRLVLVDRTGVG